MDCRLPIECVHCLRRASVSVDLEAVDLKAPHKALEGRLPRGWSLVQVPTPAGVQIKVACPKCEASA